MEIIKQFTISIVNDKTLIIYQIVDDNQGSSLPYSNDANVTLDDFRIRNSSKDNICCLTF